MSKVRLVFTAYDRPSYLEQSLASWKNVRGIDLMDKTMFLEPSSDQATMIRIVAESGLDIDVKVNETKNGVLHNPWVALDWAFTQPDTIFTILAEDDLIVSPDVCEYIQAATAWYTSDDALGVCCYSAAEEGGQYEFDLKKSFGVWIWGTWRESWYDHIRDSWDHDYSTNSGVQGVEAGWDHNLNRLAKKVKPFVHPEVSRSKHIGREHGTHMTHEWFDSMRCPTFQLDR